MVVVSFAAGLISGFILLRYYAGILRSAKDGFDGVSSLASEGKKSISGTPRDAAMSGAAVGQVVWISATPLSHTRVHNVCPGATVEEALTLIKGLARLSPTTVIVDGLDGLEPPGSTEVTTAVVDELKLLSPSPVHIFLPDGGVAS
jgi:hypothetical protein